ncbi:MAG: hypothetical protein LUE27_06090 [Clostridia bacterium]|nr:hypothetical protein [Clostridia bacterium]
MDDKYEIDGRIYITVQECARRWGVSERRIAQLCNEWADEEHTKRKIEGVQKLGKYLLIPEDAPKPADGRKAAGGSIAANKKAEEGMRNTFFGGESLAALRMLENESVDLIMCELPNARDGSGRKELALPRLWTEYRRVIKPEGYIVLLASDLYSAQIVLSNQDEFIYKLVWVKNSEREDGRKAAPGTGHMDVCVFSRMGNGKIREKNIREAINEGFLHMKSVGGDALCFCNEDGSGFAGEGPDKMELGKFLACAYSEPGDFVVDNAGYTGHLASGAMYMGRNVSVSQNNAVREEKVDMGDVAFSGLPSDISRYYGSRQKARTVTEYYSNICLSTLLATLAGMPEKYRAYLTRGMLMDELDRMQNKASKGEKAINAVPYTPRES